MFAIAVTWVAVTFPVASPVNEDAVAFPVAVRFPVTSPIAVGAFADAVATAVVPTTFPMTSTLAEGGYAMFETATIPVRPAPFPTKNGADALPATSTAPAPT